jgi:hypothetical protein
MRSLISCLTKVTSARQMQSYQLALDLLDRRYHLVADAPEDVALLHVMDFLGFIKHQ